MGKQKETKLSQDLAAAMPPGQFRMILKRKIQPEVASVKQQASSAWSYKQQALDKPGI